MPGLKYQTKDNPLIRDAFPAALQNVELFEAAVALCLSFKAAGQNFQEQMCNWSLYHKGRALSGIRSKLKSGLVDEAVILATVFLMIIDVRIIREIGRPLLTSIERISGRPCLRNPSIWASEDGESLQTR